MTTTPEVSVLMPAYNREQYIAQSIQSVLDQSFSNFELIILDDCSTDDTLKKIGEFNDPRIKVLRNTTNSGISFSRNKLLDNASGKYLALLDSDDLSLPHRLATQVEFLKNNPDLLLVGSSSIAINDANKPIPSRSFLNKRYITDSEEIAATLFFRNCFYQSSVMFNSELLGSERYSMEFRSFGDYEFWVRLAHKSKLSNQETPLIQYRYHADNISHVTNQGQKKINSATILKMNCAFYFDYVPTEEEQSIHGAWQYDYLKLSSDFLKTSSQWIKKLAEMNDRQKKFEQHIFAKVIQRNWLERCWYSANKGNTMAAIDFIRYSPQKSFKQAPLFFYLAAKCLYTRLRKR